MLPYTLTEEKETILHYAKLLGDATTEAIIQQDELRSRDEALHLAGFFWRMVAASNTEDEKTGSGSEYILEKIIITLMAYFRSAGYEAEWEEVADKN